MDKLELAIENFQKRGNNLLKNLKYQEEKLIKEMDEGVEDIKGKQVRFFGLKIAAYTILMLLMMEQHSQYGMQPWIAVTFVTLLALYIITTVKYYYWNHRLEKHIRKYEKLLDELIDEYIAKLDEHTDQYGGKLQEMGEENEKKTKNGEA